MYEVRHKERSFVVDLGSNTCACGLWQLSGLPCEHALSCISHNKESLATYVDHCYCKETYSMAYYYTIKPLNDPGMWEPSNGPELKAPDLPLPKRGVKQKKRKLEASEMVTTKKDKGGNTYKQVRRLGQVQHCSLCKEGHNKRMHGKVTHGPPSHPHLCESN
ncbi:hypothetical protein LINPERPRIM_LOCUS17121 [Linum perenne]